MAHNDHCSVPNTCLCDLEHCLDGPLIMTGLVLFWACSSDWTPTQWRIFSQCLGWTSPDTVLFHEGTRKSAPPSLPSLKKLCLVHILLQSGILGWSRGYAEVCDGVHIQIRHRAATTAHCDKQISFRISCALPDFWEKFRGPFLAGCAP